MSEIPISRREWLKATAGATALSVAKPASAKVADGEKIGQVQFVETHLINEITKNVDSSWKSMGQHTDYIADHKTDLENSEVRLRSRVSDEIINRFKNHSSVIYNSKYKSLPYQVSGGKKQTHLVVETGTKSNIMYTRTSEKGYRPDPIKVSKDGSNENIVVKNNKQNVSKSVSPGDSVSINSGKDTVKMRYYRLLDERKDIEGVRTRNIAKKKEYRTKEEDVSSTTVVKNYGKLDVILEDKKE